MKMLLVFALILVLCICLGACSSNRTGYVYEDGSWKYVSGSYFSDAGKMERPMDVEKKGLKILKDKEFARDKENIYYRGRIVEDADPDTFQVIHETGRVRYAIDKDHVFVCFDGGDFIIYGADPNSFEVIELPYSKDKNDAYCGILPLFTDDVTKFEVIEGAGLSRITSPDAFLNDEANNARYNREKYKFVTEPVIYSEGGRARTETMDYYGYIAVEAYDPLHLKIYADLTPFGLGVYELRHEGAKKLWDLTNEEPDHLYIGHRNVRNDENWDGSHKGTDVMYDVIYYENTYIIIPPLWENRGGLYYWGYIYLCKDIDKDVDMFSIGILDPEAVEKLRELPGEQMSRKDIVGKLGKSY